MAKASTTHPSSRELAAFRRGELSAGPADTVARHLETCAACRQAVEDGPTASVPGETRADQAAAGPGAPPRLPPELADHPRFRVVRELGRGGMGVVYQAEHRMMERRVAIKVINRALLDHPDALARFHAEVKAAAKLAHPNIVAAYDAEQAGDLHLLVMEFVEGTDLAKVVARRGPLPVAHACVYVRQAALGLQHAFEQGMVHRDIKPQNLMLTPKGRVKVLDFGLARLRSEHSQAGGLTQQGAFMGTPEYVAPEQATDARAADIRADVYSLGCTLYCLLAGRPPFAADTPLKLVLAHLEQEPPALQEVRPDVPPELAAVVARMLAKDPAQRYQTPAEVAQALAPFTPSGGMPAPGQKTVTAPQGTRPAGAGKAVTMPATASPTTGLARPASPRTARLPARRKRWPILLGAAGAAVAGLAALGVLAVVLLRRPVTTPVTEAAVPPAEKTPAEKWFAVGTKWEGKTTLTNRPGELAMWFTVRSREGNKFKGRLVGEGRGELAIEGTLADDGTSFRLDSARHVPNVWQPEQADWQGFEAAGKYTAERIHFDWKRPLPDGQVVEGITEFIVRRDGPRNDDEEMWPPPLHPRRASVASAGKWSVEGDELVQDEFVEDTNNNPVILIGNVGWKDYDFHVKAMKTGGENGFIVIFDGLRPGKKISQWCIGLVGNRETYVEIAESLPTGFKLTPLSDRQPATVADNQWYDILIQTRGQWIECFLDGASIFRVPHPDRWGGKVGFTTLRMTARFKDIEVKAPDGKVLWQGPPELPE
jgi:hypothetical protein